MSINNNGSIVQVSVFCLVYNQKKFLEKCLRSLIEQKTNFAFEIIVHDDKSTDGSQKIIEKFQKLYPDIIVPIFQKINQYSNGVAYITNNFMLPLAKGKYVAFCEGDDYWCDENKLQRQYDFMESHSDYSICLHNTLKHDLSGEKEDSLFNTWHSLYEMKAKDIFFGWRVHTSSYFIRKKYVYVPDFATKYWFADYVYLTLAYSYGKVAVLPQIMSVYNSENKAGVTFKNAKLNVNDLSMRYKERAIYLEDYNRITNFRFDVIIKKRLMEIDFMSNFYIQNEIMENAKDILLIKRAAKKIRQHPYFLQYWRDMSGIKKITKLIRYNGFFYPKFFLKIIQG